MIRHLWITWGVMTAAIVVNAVASFVLPVAMWATVPAALFFVWHFGRVMWGPRWRR